MEQDRQKAEQAAQADQLVQVVVRTKRVGNSRLHLFKYFNAVQTS